MSRVVKHYNLSAILAVGYRADAQEIGWVPATSSRNGNQLKTQHVQIMH